MNTRSYVRWSVLGCALVLAAGCSTATQKSALDRASSARSMGALTLAHADGSEVGSKKDLPVPEQPAIETWVREFSGRKHKSFQTQLDRSTQYVKPAMEIFADRGLPKDLIYVALVESGFTPKARSKAKAVGMYQFIPDTGRRFGLEQNQWIDERCNPTKAARAAADYLSALYDQFGSWPLALAAYNCGERAVQSTLDRTGLKTFWELAANGHLPSETRDYVPKVLATVKIVRNANRYGFYLGTGRHAPKKVVSVPGGVKLSWVGKQIGVSEDVLQDCNPELCKPVTPPSCAAYNLCVPEGAAGEGVLASLVQRAQEEQHEAYSRSLSPSSSDERPSGTSRRADSRRGTAGKKQQVAKESSGSRSGASSHSVTVTPVAKAASKTAETKAPKGKSSPAQVASNKSSGTKQKSPDAVQSSKRQATSVAATEGKARVASKGPTIQNGPSLSQKQSSGQRIVIASDDSASKRAAKKKAKP